MNNEKTAIYFKGALEPLIMKEPMQATMMNMNAAVHNSSVFFVGTDIDDHMVCIAIPQVQYMKDVDDD